MTQSRTDSQTHSQTQPQFFVTPGVGELFLRERHYSQAVRVGDLVHVSGQGGWDDALEFPADLEEEIARAFDNVERVLAQAGASWQDVVAVDSFHVPVADREIGEQHTQAMVEQLHRRMGGRAPVWTAVGVPVLAAVGMRVEIRVTAVATAAAA